VFSIQFIKFVLVGFLNTIVYVGTLNILMFFSHVNQGWLYSLFVTISLVISIVCSYVLNKRWTFQRGKTFQTGEFSKFVLISVVSISINVVFASLLNNSLGPQFGIPAYLWANFSALVASGFTVFLRFFGYKYLVFQDKPLNH